jgi:hypothetical protein
MMDSLSRSMMSLKVFLPDSNPPFDLIEHYIAKKTYYPAAINRVLGVLDRGYKHRVTFNGEIGRNYDDLRNRWNEIQSQIQKLDDTLRDLGVHDGVNNLARQVKGLSIITEGRPPSAASTSSTTTLTQGGVSPGSPTAQTSSRGSSIRSGNRVTSLPPQRRESLIPTTPTPRNRSVSTTTSSSSRSARFHSPLFTPRSKTSAGQRPLSAIGTGGLIPIEARPRWNSSPIANVLGTPPPKIPAVVVTPSRIPRSAHTSPPVGGRVTPTRSSPSATPPSSSPHKRIPVSVGRGTTTSRLNRMVSNPNLQMTAPEQPPPVPKIPDLQARRQTANFSNMQPLKPRGSGIPRPATAQGMISGLTAQPPPKWRG